MSQTWGYLGFDSKPHWGSFAIDVRWTFLDVRQFAPSPKKMDAALTLMMDDQKRDSTEHN